MLNEVGARQGKGRSLLKDPRNRIRTAWQDRLLSVAVCFVYTVCALVCIFPFYYIMINSISANDLSEQGKIVFFPQEIHFTNYVSVFKLPGLGTALFVSLARTAAGTLFTVVVAAFLGYMFTRETLWHRKLWFRFVMITMFFNAGLIPWALSMDQLGLRNSFWIYILPLIVQPFYIVLCKTYVESIPKEMQEAAEIDGAGPLRVFLFVMLPVIRPILATIAVFAAVNQWNSFQDTLLMVTDKRLYTLQYTLWSYINQASAMKDLASSAAFASQETISPAHAATAASIRMTVTVLTMLPVILVYPIFQRFFLRGVITGAVKG